MLKIIVIALGIITHVDATITSKSIADFNIGQLFAFYNMAALCKSSVQFAMAKQNNSLHCQWKIDADFVPKDVANETELPIVDMHKHCIFSCDYKQEQAGFLAEDLINQYFDKNENSPISDYDIYTYLSPCDRSIRGNHSDEQTAFFKKYSGVFFSSNPDSCQTDAKEIINENILKNGSVTGLFAAQKSTYIDIEEVKNTAHAINYSQMKMSDVEAKNQWLANALNSYFEQHSKIGRNTHRVTKRNFFPTRGIN